jgi:hypothetical protein
VRRALSEDRERRPGSFLNRRLCSAKHLFVWQTEGSRSAIQWGARCWRDRLQTHFPFCNCHSKTRCGIIAPVRHPDAEKSLPKDRQ